MLFASLISFACDDGSGGGGGSSAPATPAYVCTIGGGGDGSSPPAYTCTNGTPTPTTIELDENIEECASCHEGFRLSQGFCKTGHNYVCHGGTARLLSALTITRNEEACGSCNDGTDPIKDSNGVQICSGYTGDYPYICTNGTAESDSTDNKMVNVQNCTACDTGFCLDDSECKKGFKYVCLNGTEDSGITFTRNDNKCTSCDAGFTLNDSNFCVSDSLSLDHLGIWVGHMATKGDFGFDYCQNTLDNPNGNMGAQKAKEAGHTIARFYGSTSSYNLGFASDDPDGINSENNMMTDPEGMNYTPDQSKSLSIVAYTATTTRYDNFAPKDLTFSGTTSTALSAMGIEGIFLTGLGLSANAEFWSFTGKSADSFYYAEYHPENSANHTCEGATVDETYGPAVGAVALGIRGRIESSAVKYYSNARNCNTTSIVLCVSR